MDKVDEIDWDTEDDLEIEDFPISSGSIITNHDGETTVGSGIASSSTDPSYSKLINHFLAMGFPVRLVTEAIEENGEGNADAILETLLAYSALDNNSPQGKQRLHSDSSSSDYYESFLDDLSDSSLDIEDLMNPSSDQENKLLVLADMGYTIEEASIAIERCGTDSSIAELADFICAAQMARTEDFHLGEEEKQKRKLLYNDYSKCKKRKIDHERLQQKKQKYSRKLFQESYDMSHIPNPMIGYGIPTDPSGGAYRTLPEAAVGPPYFYFENVALAPRGVWNTISRFLYEVEPEYVDSKYFCAAARKRGYIHNLPVENRFPLLPLPPCTINDALPLTRKWWPAWDMRTKLNCLQTCIGTARLTERIRKALENCEGDPPLGVQKYVLEECRKWNLVWVGRNKAAPLEPDEVEMLLGFPKNHTRGGGISRTDRYKSLGNSFQIDTVAYHLSVLKDLYPHGINLLSLFSGIGGAEVALHRLGIQLKNAVSVEISEVNRNIIKSWWEQTNQKGRLIEIADVQELHPDRLEELVNSLGGFDLVIGGSPCNNLTGSNRYTRDGLEGKDSSLFYHFFRILDSVRCMMGRKQ